MSYSDESKNVLFGSSLLMLVLTPKEMDEKIYISCL